MKRLFPELLVAGIVLLPLCYLWFAWNRIPETVPVSYSISGDINRWGAKSELLLYLPLTAGIQYILLLLLPLFDPKKKILGMGKKYFAFRIMLSSSLCATLLIYIKAISDPSFSFMQMLMPLLCVILIVTGNLIQSVKPNYVFGVRTPWTLTNDNNWQQTHRFAARVYMAGGFVLLLISLVPGVISFRIVFFLLVFLLLLCPVFYSYWIHRKTNSR